jgi:hypothetical protein
MGAGKIREFARLLLVASNLPSRKMPDDWHALQMLRELA